MYKHDRERNLARFWLRGAQGVRGFSQVDQGPHKHLGYSEVGIRIEKIIKVEMNIEDVFDSKFTFVRGYMVLLYKNRNLYRMSKARFWLNENN